MVWAPVGLILAPRQLTCKWDPDNVFNCQSGFLKHLLYCLCLHTACYGRYMLARHVTYSLAVYAPTVYPYML